MSDEHAPSTNSPSPLQHARLRPAAGRSSAGKSVLKFFGGMFGGFAITIAYVFFSSAVGSRSSIGWILLLASFGGKVSLGATLCCFKRWRFVGAGILTSIALGGLVIGAGIVYGIYWLSQCKPI